MNGADEQVRRREDCPRERQERHRRKRQDHERDQEAQAGHAQERDQPDEDGGGDEFDLVVHASSVLRTRRLRIRQTPVGLVGHSRKPFAQ